MQFSNNETILGDERGKVLKKDKASQRRRCRRIYAFISIGKYPTKLYFNGRADHSTWITGCLSCVLYYLFFQLAILLFANLYFNKVYTLEEEIVHLDQTAYLNWKVKDLHNAKFQYPIFHLTVSNWQKMDPANKPCGDYSFYIYHRKLDKQTKMIRYN
jgi:hypothetical protein